MDHDAAALPKIPVVKGAMGLWEVTCPEMQRKRQAALHGLKFKALWSYAVWCSLNIKTGKYSLCKYISLPLGDKEEQL